VIPHLHIHIIPRRADDGLKHWPGQAYASAEEARQVAGKIKM
jgi:diadenosine tetraphosphate (Ap4A) HIT family hydrolase